MAIDMFMFDYRLPEKNYFETYNLDCFNIKFFERSLNEETLAKIPPEELENVTALSVFIDSELSKDVIKKFKNLRIIATRSTGVDHIDIDYCRENRIAVTNVENYGATSVAQYTFALILALLRNLVPANLYMRDYNRSNNVFLGRDLTGLTLGVIGTGAIGGSVCKLAQDFGMSILACDIFPKEELRLKYNVKYVDMDELLADSDVITLHLPYTKDNLNMISMAQFEKMRKKPYLINTSRGELVNLEDLRDALSKNLLAGAGLDVLSCESLTFRCDETCPVAGEAHKECIEELKIVKEIKNFDNVVITPHIAYETKEAVEYILRVSMVSIMDFFKGGYSSRVV